MLAGGSSDNAFGTTLTFGAKLLSTGPITMSSMPCMLATNSSRVTPIVSSSWSTEALLPPDARVSASIGSQVSGTANRNPESVAVAHCEPDGSATDAAGEGDAGAELAALAAPDAVAPGSSDPEQPASPPTATSAAADTDVRIRIGRRMP